MLDLFFLEQYTYCFIQIKCQLIYSEVFHQSVHIILYTPLEIYKVPMGLVQSGVISK